MLKLGPLGKSIIIIRKFLKCGAGEGWRKSFGPIASKMKMQRNILHRIKRRKAKWLGYVLRRDRLFKTPCGRKDKRKDRRDVKTRKKTSEGNGRP